MASSSNAEKQSRFFLRLLIPFLLVGFFAAWNLRTWPARITYPGDESYEGFALTDIVQLRNGVPIYSAQRSDGFADATYGPLYYLLAGRLINPAHPSYLPLRILSALAMLGCALCCGVLAFWLTGKKSAAGLAAVTFLAWGIVTGHGILALSDGVAVLLAFMGFLVAYRFRENRGILLAVPLMLASFYYKPQYVSGPVAVFIFLLIERRYRLAAEFAGLMSAGGLGVLAFFQWVIFRGQNFSQFFLFHQVALLSWELFTRRTLPQFAIVLLPALFFVLASPRVRGERLLVCYLLSAAVLEVFTYSKAGSEFQYFFELTFVLSALIALIVIPRLIQRVYPLDILLFFSVVLFIQQALPSSGPTRYPGASDIADYEAMQSFLRHNFAAGTPSLSTVPADALQAGLDVPYPGLFVLTLSCDRGIRSDRGLVNEIRGRRFAVIILGIDVKRETDPYWLNFLLTPGVLAAIRRDYRLTASFDMPIFLRHRPQDKFYIYVPQRPLKPPRRHQSGARAERDVHEG